MSTQLSGASGIPYVYILSVVNSLLYVGGVSWTVAGSSNIANWDGAVWTAMGTGVNDAVRGVELFQNELYVAGFFTQAGGQFIRYLAKYDGNWNAVPGANLNSNIFDLTITDTDLYFGGAFTSVNGTTMNRIAKFNGTNYSTFGAGFGSNVVDVQIINSDVYVGGLFTASTSPLCRKMEWHSLDFIWYI